MAGTYATKYMTKEELEEYGKRQNAEVDANSRAFFDELLPELLKEHRGKYALMRDKKVVKIFDDFSSACFAGDELFDDCVFSVQEITDESVDMRHFYRI